MAADSHSPGIFAFTRLKLFLFVSLAITWWFASLLPRYQPIIQAKFKSRIDEAREKIPSIKVDWHQSDDDPRNAYNRSKVALMIEPRPLPHLVPQILHMMAVVPPDWRFLFIGSEKSVVSVGRAYSTKHQQVIGKLDLMTLPAPWEIDTKEKVYRLLTDTRFYSEFMPGVEWILKYEADSILCANSDDSLNNWLDWHWAGAPRKVNDRFAGNGGLSLRRVSAIQRVLGFQARYNDTEAEDEWFGKRMWILPGAKVASGSDGQLAVEDVYIEKPMGFHARDGGKRLADDVWKNPKQREQILNYCPELSMIMDMKLERERCPGDDKQGVIQPSAEEKKAAAERKKKEDADAARAAAISDLEKMVAKEKAAKHRSALEAAKQKAVEQASSKGEFAMVGGKVVIPTPIPPQEHAKMVSEMAAKATSVSESETTISIKGSSADAALP